MTLRTGLDLHITFGDIRRNCSTCRARLRPRAQRQSEQLQNHGITASIYLSMCNTAKHSCKAHSLTACGFYYSKGGRVPAQAKTANRLHAGSANKPPLLAAVADFLIIDITIISVFDKYDFMFHSGVMLQPLRKLCFAANFRAIPRSARFIIIVNNL